MASPPVQIIVEIQINNVWKDISQYVYERDNIIITGGAAAQQASNSKVAQCTMTLNNRDGRFSPNYAGGAYYPYLTRNVPIRMSLAFTNGPRRYDGYRFQGTVTTWPPLSDSTGTDIYVQIVAQGPQRQVATVTTKDSALVRYYGQLTGAKQPIAYWPCEENNGAKSIGSALTGGQNMLVTAGTPTWKAVDAFNGSAPIPIVNRSTWVGNVTSSGTVTSVFLRLIVFVPKTGGNDNCIIARWATGGTLSRIDLYYIKGGQMQVKGYKGSTLVFNTSPRPHAVDGQPVMMSVELTNSGSNVVCAFRSIVAGAHAYTDSFNVTGTACQVGLVSSCTIDPNADITQTAIAQIAVQYNSADALTDLSAYISNAMNAHDGEISMKRFVRLMNEQALAPKPVYHEGVDHFGFDVGDNVLTAQSSMFTSGLGTWGADNPTSNATIAAVQPPVSNGTDWAMSITSNNNSSIVTPGMPASGTNVTNGNTFPIVATISGGTISNVLINGVSAGTGDGAYTVPAGETISITYSSAPTWVWSVQAWATNAPQASLLGSYDFNVATQVPVAWWKLNDLPSVTAAQTFLDSSGNGLTGASTAVATQQAVAVNPWRSAGFNGTSSFVGITGYIAPSFSAMTAAILVNLDNNTGGNSFQQMLSTADTGNGGATDIDLGFNMFLNKSTRVASINVGNGTGIVAPSFGPALSADGWHLLVATYDGTNVRTYQDGVLQNTVAFTGPVAAATKHTAIGADCEGTGNFFAGLLAEAVIDNSAWSQATITALFNSITYQPTAMGVFPGQFVDVVGQFLGGTTVRPARMAVTFWNALGAFISGQYATGVNDSLSAWTSVNSLHAQVPAGAMWARAEAWFQGITGANEVGYVSGVGVMLNNDIQNWTISNGSGSLAQDSSWVSEGDYSLKATASSTGIFLVQSPTGPVGAQLMPVNPGDFVTASIDIHTNTGSAAVNEAGAEIAFFTSANAYHSSIFRGGSTSVVNAKYTALAVGATDTIVISGVVPTGVTCMTVKFGDYSSGGASGRIINGDMMVVGAAIGPQQKSAPKELISEVQNIDRGIAREERKLLALGYKTRIRVIYQPVALQIDYSKQQLSAVPLPVVDTTRTSNDITVQNTKGSKVRVVLTTGSMSLQAPPNGIGKLSKKVKAALADDQQLLNMAEWLLNLATGAGERYPQINVNMLRPATAPIMDACANLEIGDYLQIINLPFWYPNTKAKQLVNGYTETINQFHWDIQWNCVDQSPYDIQVLSRW